MVDRHSHLLFISVSDTGSSIAQVDLERVFDPFEQVNNDSGAKYEGTGLGLPLTRDLVNLHKGIIWTDSLGKGRGSQFSMLIPIYAHLGKLHL